MEAGVLETHTATQQWQSFEMRMRRRRAERCALRAEVALEAGFPDDAREALDEARRLDPSVADFDALQAVVVEREALRREQRAQETRRRRRLGVAAGVLLAAGAGAWMITRDAVPSSRFPVPGSVIQGSLVQASVAMPTTPALSSPESRTPSPEPRTGNREPGTWNREREELPSLPSATILTDITLPAVSRPEPPLPALAQPVSDAVPPTMSVPAVVDEGPRVRAALARYEALARAFDGLESQQLSLGHCTVAIDGAGARAECNGTATWTPRVGGGSRTEPRNWRFELKNAAGEWQIVRAEAR